MANFRKIKFTPTKPTGALVVFSIQGRLTDFPDGKAITANIEQDACYDVLLTCNGNAGDKAAVEFAAVSKEFAIYICTPTGDLTREEYKKLSVEVPAGESAWVNTSKIAVRRKADKPAK
ncbi:MAG: hypothetical protein ACTS1Z_14540 [Parasphingopyxis sp.]